LKKYATHFFNHAFGTTEEKEAANPVTGVSKINYLEGAIVFPKKSYSICVLLFKMLFTMLCLKNKWAAFLWQPICFN
jgi:hypothetical protein